MLASWLLFPLILLAVTLGCGLLLEAAAKVRLPGALLLGAGLTVVIVVAQITTASDFTAEATTPVVVAIALAGLALRARRERLRLDPWAVAACAAVYAVYAAPIVLSGQPTFGGYIKLDDTATWMALADRVMTHGHDLSGLAPSTYQLTLAFNLGNGYPVGAFLALGVGHQLAGQDLAWVIAPYMALVAVILASSLYAVVSPLLSRSPAARDRGVPGSPVGPALRLLPLGRDQGAERGGADRHRRRPRRLGDAGAARRALARSAHRGERRRGGGPERRRRGVAGADHADRRDRRGDLAGLGGDAVASGAATSPASPC